MTGFQTSLGQIHLTADEATILERLEAGIAPHEEGLVLYDSVVARLSVFPTEWEILILRSAVAALPGRADLLARLHALEQPPSPPAPAPPSPAPDLITIETTLGPLALNPDEAETLERLNSGRARSNESQAWYVALMARGLPFPPEWEVLVLRASLAEWPDRDDLLMRLALLSVTVGPGDRFSAETRERLAFEQAWHRFSLNAGLTDENLETRREARGRAFEAASQLLSATVFPRLPAQRRAGVIAAIHDTMMSAPSEDLFLLAELGLRQFPALLAEPDLTEAAACRVYDGLHSLAFSGVSNVRDLSRFDRAAPAFERWLRQRLPPAPVLPMPDKDKPLTIAYLLHTAHFDRGNAVSQLVVPLAEAHARQANRKILLYATQFVGPDFVESVATRGIMLRSFPQGTRYDQIAEIARSLAEEAVDVVITEQNRAVSTALFVRRVAPLQIWLDTGFPFWGVEALDWTLSPVIRRDAGHPLRTSPIVWGQTSETLGQAADPDAIAALRANFPKDSFVLGVFVRLVKLDAAYLAVMKRMLLADERFHLVIAGPGDPDAIIAFAQDPALQGRVTLHPGMADLDLYGSAIDLMCDTFPFIGGNACRQVSARGTPVLARLGTPWDAVLEADRNPDLLARDDDDFIALVIRMAQDPGFRQKQRDVALKMAVAYTDPAPMLADVEAAIAAAREHFADR